jgi:DNA-binding HxlR family transcriptional regulator
MRMHPSPEDRICEHYQAAARLVARRWVPLVISAMQGRTLRYSDLKASIPDISDAVLSERLKELEAASVVTRTVAPTTPVRIEYALTERGEELATVLDELRVWADRWAKEPAASG